MNRIFLRIVLCTMVLLGCSFHSLLEAGGARKTGTVNVGTDNNGDPLIIAYAKQGHNDGRPVIIFCDTYFGINAYRCLQQNLSNDFFTISFDQIGYGLSSKPDPTNLDGVFGETGYSFQQYAIFVHKLLEGLNIQGPITWVGLDTQGQVGMKYAVTYPSGPLAIAKLVMINSGPAGIVSDDPCSLAFLTTAQAAGVAAFYAADPCTALCALLSASFITTDCPQANTILTNACVKYSATLPSAVFSRLFNVTFLENVANLQPLITIPTLILYGSTGEVSPINRTATGISFMEYNPGFPGSNPVVPGTCACGAPTYQPFPDVRLLVYPGHGTPLHLSAFERFVDDLKKFVLGTDSACSLCPIDFDSPDTCPDCS